MSYAYGSEHGGTAYHENRYEDAPEQHQEIDNRPKDLTDQQDKVIQLVAKYVVYSEDGARYQSKLLSKTRHNPYFAFLTSPDHKYYNYYQYLLQSYSLWKNLAASMEGSSYHQQGEADESAWDYGTQYAQAAGETADNGQEKGIAGAGGAGNASAQERATVPLSNSGGGAVPNANSEGDRGNGSPSGHIAAPGEADDDDDDQPQFQIIMENGVAKAVPVSR